jgi:hypothetical protein
VHRRRLLVMQFNSVVVWLLIAAMGLSIVLGDYADAVAIASSSSQRRTGVCHRASRPAGDGGLLELQTRGRWSSGTAISRAGRRPAGAG